MFHKAKKRSKYENKKDFFFNKLTKVKFISYTKQTKADNLTSFCFLICSKKLINLGRHYAHNGKICIKE